MQVDIWERSNKESARKIDGEDAFNGGTAGPIVGLDFGDGYSKT